ncbi:hypothetical protein MAR_005989 [Mya arenaria]|uniref:Uncharacterized protein n=1 Tax=Mya arenaria TaxID=6604 RepID=A0ABY7D990_MYAAR|nr:hypothetical protein MAR_005989 [Mya arenaria]
MVQYYPQSTGNFAFITLSFWMMPVPGNSTGYSENKLRTVLCNLCASFRWNIQISTKDLKRETMWSEEVISWLLSKSHYRAGADEEYEDHLWTHM